MSATYSLIVALYSLGVVFAADFGLNGPWVDKSLTLAALGALAIFIRAGSNALVSPARLYAVSVLAFILARPVISLFAAVELVEVGSGDTPENMTKTLAVIALSVAASSFAFAASRQSHRSPSLGPQRLRLKLPAMAQHVALAGMLSFGLVFLVYSWSASRLLSTMDYFSAVDDPRFHAHIYLFFLAKTCAIVWLVSDTSRSRFRLCAAWLCVFAAGFLLIGLRGYFISYLFLWIYFFNERHRISLPVVVVASAALLYLASFVLEYRLGFAIYENLSDMILMPLYQQGASFEVVFGTVAFPHSVAHCLPVSEYLFGTAAFGNCVDVARGVPFDEGGFASSFFAEAYYLGVPVLIALSGLIGLGVKYLQLLSERRTSNQTKGVSSFTGGFIMFYVLPNLVYFARSSAFDFISKLFVTIAICAIFFTARGRNRRYRSHTALQS